MSVIIFEDTQKKNNNIFSILKGQIRIQNSRRDLGPLFGTYEGSLWVLALPDYFFDNWNKMHDCQLTLSLNYNYIILSISLLFPLWGDIIKALITHSFEHSSTQYYNYWLVEYYITKTWLVYSKKNI